MTGASRLGLGTAQFGLPYGITNRSGQVEAADAAAILAAAAAAGIDTIDTAYSYGQSERTIGAALAARSAFRIVTKSPKLGGLQGKEAAARLREAFIESLGRLQVAQVNALLLHDPADLLGASGPAIWREMERLKADELVSAIGVSVYDAAEIDLILERFSIDLIQLPFNALDRRLVDGGQLSRLKARGVEVHARSLFLQGLLLADEATIPARFAPVREAVRVLDRAFDAHNLTRLEGLLAIAFGRNELDRLIVGVTSVAELRDIVLATERAASVQDLELPDLPDIDARFLNPARWGELDSRAQSGEKDAL